MNVDEKIRDSSPVNMNHENSQCNCNR